MFKTQKQYDELKLSYIQKWLIGDIYKSLGQMNTTHTMYFDENEANRELTTCLKLLGHDALYNFRINNRLVDIFCDNSIIEGKLEPTNTEVDRLIGQVSDFLQTPCHIYIVLYGIVKPEIVNRIKLQVIANIPNRINLIYLLNPLRSKIPVEDRTILDNKFIQDYSD